MQTGIRFAPKTFLIIYKFHLYSNVWLITYTVNNAIRDKDFHKKWIEQVALSDPKKCIFRTWRQPENSIYCPIKECC